MANPSTAAKAIQPDSTEYGSRKKLQAGLQQILGQQAGPPGMMGGGMPGAPSVAPSPMDPMGMLLGDEYGPTDFGSEDMVLTDGLSVGPGAGPQDMQEVPIGDLQSRLIAIAQYAKTPHLRLQARLALRRLVREHSIEGGR